MLNTKHGLVEVYYYVKPQSLYFTVAVWFWHGCIISLWISKGWVAVNEGSPASEPGLTISLQLGRMHVGLGGFESGHKGPPR